MRSATALLILVALLAAAPVRASTTPRPTEIVRWSPFDSAGKLKATLNVKAVDGRCTDIGYTYVGGIGYRCGSGHVLFDTCFRDGPNPTDYVICVDRPWQRNVVRLHSPHFLFYPGVTFTRAAEYPWGIVLADGNRCGVFQGAHASARLHSRTYIVDYYCEKGHVVLMREGIERGRVWTLIAARWSAANGFTSLGRVSVRRVYFGALPEPMDRQNTEANQAYKAAVRVVKAQAPAAHLDLAWVRLSLPDSTWAYVIFTPADASFRGWFAVLHRMGGKWIDASAYKPYCTRVPVQVRRQLFLPRVTPGFHPGDFLAPRGETRC